MMGSPKSLSGPALLLACLLSLLLVSASVDFRSTLHRLTTDDLFKAETQEFEDPTDVREMLQSLPTTLTHPQDLADARSQVGEGDSFVFLNSLPSTESSTQTTDFELATTDAETDAQFEPATEEETDTDALLDEMATLASFGSLNLSPEVALSFSTSGSFSFDFSFSEIMSFSVSDFSFSGFSFEFSAEFSTEFSTSGSGSGSDSGFGSFSFEFSGSDDMSSSGFSDFSAGNSDFSMSGDLSDFSGVDFSSSGDASGGDGGMGGPCRPGRCKNDGECIDGPMGFYCECRSHYSGPTCEVHTPSSVATMDRPVITHTSSDHVYIQWTLPAYPPAANITSFSVVVYVVPASGGRPVFWARHILSHGLRATRIYGLEVGKTFEFSIYAVTESDHGEPSPRVRTTTRLAPPWGLSVLALRDLQPDSMTAFWYYPADLNDYTTAETSFILELAYTAADDEGVETDYVETYAGIYGTEYTFVGLSGGINYTVTFYAENPFGISEVWNGLESAILPTFAPSIVGFYALNNPSAPAAVGLSPGDKLVLLFDLPTSQPVLTSANIYNFLQFDGATGTFTLSPSWTDLYTLELTIDSYTSGATFPLGAVTVSIGDATSIASADLIGLYAATSIGGSLEAASGVSDPVGGNFGFASAFLAFTGTAATDEDVPATFAALGASFITDSSATVYNLYAKPFRAGAKLSSAGVADGSSTSPLHLSGTTVQLAALFAAVVYTPAPNMNGYGGLSFSVELAGAQVYFDSLRVLVRPVNDAPSLQVPASLAVNVDEGTLIRPTVNVSDVDVALNPLATLKVAVVTNSELHQCWFTNATAGVAYGTGSFSTKAQKVELTGRVASVQAALKMLKCSFGLDDPMASPTLTVVVDDLANGATTGALDKTSAIVSSVTPVTVSCVQAVLTAPSLTFANDATAVLIRFSKTTQIPSPTDFDCSAWIDGAALSTLGTAPKCFGVTASNPYTLTVQLGSGSTVALDAPLLLKNFRRCPTATVPWTGGNVPVDRPPAPVAPTVVIDAPSQVASCDDLTLSAVPGSGTGGRDVTYLWSSSPAGVFTTTTRTQQSPVVRPAAGTYTITVTVTNFVGAQSATASTTVTVLGVAAPQIRVQGGAKQSIAYRRNGEIRVSASAELASCFADSDRTVDFTWTSSNTIASSAIRKGDGTTLILDAGTLVRGVYTFTVKGVQRATPSVSGVANLTLTILPPVPSVAGGSGPFQKYTSSAFSVTPLLDDVPAQGATYSWTCVNSGSACYNRLTKAALAMTRYNTSTFSYLANTLGAGVYSLTLTVSAPGVRTINVPVALEVLPTPAATVAAGASRRLLATTTRKALPTVAVACTGCQTGTGAQAAPWVVAQGGIAVSFAATVTPDVPSLNCTKTYQWEVTPSSALSLTSANPQSKYFTLNQELSASFFALNQQYQLSLQATATCTDNSVQSSTVTLYFATAKPPILGLFSASVTNSDASPMTLTAANWNSDNLPLTYVFYHRDAANQPMQYITSDIKKPNNVVWARPIPGLASNSGNRIVGVIIRDSYGNQATAEKSVGITATATLVDATASANVAATLSEQSGKGSTEGINQVVQAWGKAVSSFGLPDATVIALRNLLLSSAVTTVTSSSAAAMISAVLSAQGASTTQLDVNTAVLASNIVAAALANLNSYGASGASGALTASTQVAGNQLLASRGTGSIGGSSRRLLAINGDAATKQAVNSSYLTLYSTLAGASRSIIANPGQVWRSTNAPVSLTVTRFVATTGVVALRSATLPDAAGDAAVTAPSGLNTTGNLDLHFIFTAPNPFSWDTSLPRLLGGAATVRYATATGALTDVAAGVTTSVYLPWSGSCTGTGCIPRCVLWNARDDKWISAGVTTGATSVDGGVSRVQCDVPSTAGSAFTVSLMAYVAPVSTGAGAGGSTSTGAAGGLSGGAPGGSTAQGSTGSGGVTPTPTFVEVYFYITPATFPSNFKDLMALELANAAMPVGGNVADYQSRFQVISYDNVEVAGSALRLQATKTKVVVHILESAGGASAATLFANLAAAMAKGLTGTYLSTASGLVRLCDDGQYASTCSTGGTSSGVGSTPAPESSSGGGMGGIIGGVVGGVVVLILVAGGLYRYRKNRPPKVHDSSLVAQTDAA